MPLYKIVSGKHFIRKNGEEIKYVTGDVLELSQSPEVVDKQFPGRFIEVNRKVEPVEVTERTGTPVVTTANTAGGGKSATKPSPSPAT